MNWRRGPPRRAARRREESHDDRGTRGVHRRDPRLRKLCRGERGRSPAWPGRGGRPAGRERRREDHPDPAAARAAARLRRRRPPVRRAAVPPDQAAHRVCAAEPRPLRRSTPAENLAFSAKVFGHHASADLPAALSIFGRTVVGSLPLGAQRKTAFAQALAHHPDLLVLDEPTSGVDPLSRARLWETVAESVVAGAGVLVTTHYMDEAWECDRLMIMADGRVVAQGTAAEIVGDARVSVVEAESWASAFGAHP